MVALNKHFYMVTLNDHFYMDGHGERNANFSWNDLESSNWNQ